MSGEMTDEELSLKVASIIYHQYKWEPFGGVAMSDHDGMEFLYTDKDCAWDMAVWLAERTDGGTWLTVGELLQTKNNPQRHLAMMVLEIGQSNE